MKIVVTGATGFIGRLLTLRLVRQGHQVVALVRNPVAAASKLGPDVQTAPLGSQSELAQAIEGAGAVIHLAGAPILGRWTRAYRQQLVDSRVGLARRLVDAMRSARQKPGVFVSASAVGIYGDAGDRRLDESVPPATGFVAELCRDWEAAALEAEALGVRVVVPRIGLVLGRGGLLDQLLPLARLHLAGVLGSGQQYMPWVHVDDVIGILCLALDDAWLRGPVNCTAPEPVTNAAFTHALASTLSRSWQLPAPAFLLRAVLGQRAQVVLASQRAVPDQALRHGYQFLYPTLDTALADVVGLERQCSIERVGDSPDSSYLRQRRPRYQLRTSQTIDAPLADVFEFFARAANLGAVTPDNLSFSFKEPPPTETAAGTVIVHRIRIGPVPLTWRTVIEVWESGQRFVDAQHQGPYRAWWHEHRFLAVGERTVMDDHVFYSPPLGILGRVAHWLFIRRMLTGIFAYRTQAIRQRFWKLAPQKLMAGIAS